MINLQTLTGGNFSSVPELLAAVVEDSCDAIISKNLDGIITSWNLGAERLFGYHSTEMLGKPVTALIPNERRNEAVGILERLRNGDRVEHHITERICKNGQKINVSLSISPVRNAGGEVVGAAKIARDLTDQYRLIEAAQHAVAEAELHSRLKDEFLATLSHELRTPLQAIMGWARLLLATARPEGDHETIEGLNIIKRNSEAQSKIIEDMLDMGRILSGKLRLDIRDVNLTTIIESALETVTLAAAGREINVVSRMPSAVWIRGDADRLQQVLWNLLSNAIKFTAPGGTVHVELKVVGANAEIRVVDTGVGIDSDFLPFVFDKFRQADVSTSRRHSGLGVGLALVKHLTELHGGLVMALSQGKNKGSTFSVLLPVVSITQQQDKDPASRRGGLATKIEIPFLKGVHVLLVDDEPDCRGFVAVMLTRAGASVRTAASAEEAVCAWKNKIPDILISEIGLPAKDGHTLLQEVRGLDDGVSGGVPAIALTAYSRTEDRVRAIASGFQVLIAKPADGAEVVSVVASLLKRLPSS